jgi:ribonuclease D
MKNQLITNQSEFEKLCNQIREEGIVAFDTEFVSEYSYRPDLCLLQFAAGGHSVVVDPQKVEDLSSWWDIMRDDQTTVVVHGGQAEIRFCIAATGKLPEKMIDIQLAEGIRSPSYPMGYSSLIDRVLGIKAKGKETRTDWRRRPLSENQIFYALEDVDHVLDVWNIQKNSLEELGRLDWATDEFKRLGEDVYEEFYRDPWVRLSGIHRLKGKRLSIAVEISKWRQDLADSTNRPIRKILRDDLIIEIANRHPKTAKDFESSREFSRNDYRRLIPDLLKVVKQGAEKSLDELPKFLGKKNIDKKKDEFVLGQLLGLALSNRCAEMNISKQIVGTSSDLREFVQWHIEGRNVEENGESTPSMAKGWRALVCGNILGDLLDGRISLRVADPGSSHPLAFEEFDNQ